VLGVFFGEHDNKIDTKGRVSIPADFRRQIEAGDPDWQPGRNATMAIVFGDAKRQSLEVFPLDTLQGVHEKINRMSRGDPRRRALQILYGHLTTKATMDETGRIVLPAKLRHKIGLTDMAKFVGNGDTFEIYEPEAYETAAYALFENIGEDFDPNKFDKDIDASYWLPGDAD
jgi:MraZ protein